MNNTFKAIEISESLNNTYVSNLVEKTFDDLPSGDVLIKVKYSSLNYKDALSYSGNKGVTRNYPHTPGIDAAGIVTKSSCDDFNEGDEVIVTGYDLGMNTSGGHSEYIRVPSSWVLIKPDNLSFKESMVYGTAGFTAALSVYKLINSGVLPDDGDILVTGSTGGVGSLAISILSKLGYKVVAASSKSNKRDLLLSLGAYDVVDISDIDDKSPKAILKGRWAGVIDTVGGNILATALKSAKYGAAVTCCGNVMSGELSTTVYPFILRGVSLFGIDSVMCPVSTRKIVWNKLATEWKIDLGITNEIYLTDVSKEVELMLNSKHTGRTIINTSL